MPLDPKVQIGAQLALTLASLYLPGSGQAISGLTAIFAAIQQFNASSGRAPDYVPSREELDAFIADRESKRMTEVPESGVG